MRLTRFFTLFGLTLGGEETHHYEKDEHVVLWMNTVGPYHNRQETYEYFSLPFCKGDEHEDVGKVRHHHNIGDALQVCYREFLVSFMKKIIQSPFNWIHIISRTLHYCTI